MLIWVLQSNAAVIGIVLQQANIMNETNHVGDANCQFNRNPLVQ